MVVQPACAVEGGCALAPNERPTKVRVVAGGWMTTDRRRIHRPQRGQAKLMVPKERQSRSLQGSQALRCEPRRPTRPGRTRAGKVSSSTQRASPGVGTMSWRPLALTSQLHRRHRPQTRCPPSGRAPRGAPASSQQARLLTESGHSRAPTAPTNEAAAIPTPAWVSSGLGATAAARPSGRRQPTTRSGKIAPRCGPHRQAGSRASRGAGQQARDRDKRSVR